MPTNDYSKNIVYLSKAQYQELLTNQTITVNGTTVTYNENDIYVTPQAEPITDVKINGTSIGSNGIANIPVGDANTYGVYKAYEAYGITNYNGFLRSVAAPLGTIQNGLDGDHPIVSVNQHQSVFYGLAKAAGADMKGISNTTVGTYPDAQKAAIQNMLGITDLLSTEESSTATAAHTLNSTFMMNGKLHRATAAIAVGDAVEVGTNCEVVKADEVFVKKTDVATTDTLGLVRSWPNRGISTVSDGRLYINAATDSNIKSGESGYLPIVTARQHTSIYYGLSKLAGVDLANETVTLGTYPETSKTAIRSLIGAAAASSAITDVQVNGSSVVSSNVASIPVANASTFGVVKIGDGVRIVDNLLTTNPAGASAIKAGVATDRPIAPARQEYSVFYGLSKLAGVDLAETEVTLGTYPETSKTAIRNMLGAVSSDIIAVQDEQPTAADTKVWLPETEQEGIQVPTVSEMNLALATKVGDVQVNGSSVVNNGVANIPIASTYSLGAVCTGALGIEVRQNDGVMYVTQATENDLKSGNNNYRPVCPTRQHQSVFYGLAKAAGDTTQSISTNAVGTYTDEAKLAIRNMLGAISNTDYADNNTAGVVKVNSGLGIGIDSSSKTIFIDDASDANVKAGTEPYKPITPRIQHNAVFYGLTKAAGVDMASSSNAVGTYTPEAKAAIHTMLGIDPASIAAQVDIPLVETVSGTTPSITGQPNVRYVCGEVSTLSITPPASGSMDVIFESGSTAAVLTVSNTVKWPAWFDVTSLEADTTYEILITDGVYGSVMTWAN